MKKLLIAVLINYLLFQLWGCYSPQLISKEELISIPHNEGLVVKTNEPVVYAFERGSYIIVRDSIFGKGSLILENGGIIDRDVDRQISIEEAETIELDKIDVVKTTFLIAATMGLSVLLILGIESLFGGGKIKLL